MPLDNFERERAQKAEEELRALLAAQGDPVSEETAARNWGDLKRELEREDNEQIEEWLSSSTR